MSKSELLFKLKNDFKKTPIESIDVLKDKNEYKEIIKNFPDKIITSTLNNKNINSKNFRRFSLVFSLALALLIFGTFIFYKPGATLFENYVFVNINPSIELKLDNKNIVTTQRALNKDGVLVLTGEDFVGSPANKVLERIVLISNKLGYLNTNHVLVTNVCNDKKLEKENNNSMTSNLNDFLIKQGLSNSVNNGYDESLKAESEKYKVSIAKMKIINEVHAKIHIDKLDLAKKNIEDLKEILEDYDENIIKLEEEKINGKLDERYKKMIDSLNHLKKAEIKLEIIEKNLEKENSKKIQEQVDAYNIEFPEYFIMYTNNKKDLENIIETILDKIEEDYEVIEDSLDNFKESIKNDFESENEDSDNDEDDEAEDDDSDSDED